MKTEIKGLKFNVTVNCEIGSYKEKPSNNSNYSEVELEGFKFDAGINIGVEEEHVDAALKDIADTAFKTLGEGLVDKLRAAADATRERVHCRSISEQRKFEAERHEQEMEKIRATKTTCK